MTSVILNRRSNKSHDCKLPNDDDDIIARVIDNGPFITLRRRIRELFMISRHHPYSGWYLKSDRELRHERRRHLMENYFMIHPLSMFNFWWRVTIATFLWTQFCFFSIVAPYLSPHSLQLTFSIHNVLHVVLIILSFFIGQYDKEKNKVILKPQKIAMNYLTTLFLFDAIAAGAIVLRFLLTEIHSEWNLDGRTIRILRWALPLFKFARYPQCQDTFYEIKLYFGMNHYMYLMLKYFFNLMFFMLFTNWVTFIILREVPHFSMKPPLKFALSSAEIFLMINQGQHIEDYMVDKIVPIIGISLGFLIHLTLHVHVRNLWRDFYSAESIENDMYDSLEAYMVYKALPNKTRKRVALYMEFKYQKNYYKNKAIIEATSTRLRKEVLVAVTTESSQRVDIFKSIPDNIMHKLRTLLVPIIYLPGDVIIKPGPEAEYMFFILHGTVKILTLLGQEVYYLRDGAHFGEISLLLNLTVQNRVGYIIATTPCELFILNRKHFFHILELYPKLLTELKAMAELRLRIIQDKGPSKDTLEEALVRASRQAFRSSHTLTSSY